MSHLPSHEFRGWKCALDAGAFRMLGTRETRKTMIDGFQNVMSDPDFSPPFTLVTIEMLPRSEHQGSLLILCPIAQPSVPLYLQDSRCYSPNHRLWKGEWDEGNAWSDGKRVRRKFQNIHQYDKKDPWPQIKLCKKQQARNPGCRGTHRHSTHSHTPFHTRTYSLLHIHAHTWTHSYMYAHACTCTHTHTHLQGKPVFSHPSKDLCLQLNHCMIKQRNLNSLSILLRDLETGLSQRKLIHTLRRALKGRHGKQPQDKTQDLGAEMDSDTCSRMIWSSLDQARAGMASPSWSPTRPFASLLTVSAVPWEPMDLS